MLEDLFAEISRTTSTEERFNLLKRNEDNEVFKDILRCTYTQGKKYGVLKYSISGKGSKTLDQNWPEVKHHLSLLENREITGNAAVAATEALVCQFDEFSQKVINGILRRNLAIGLTINALAAAWPADFEVFETALAVKLGKRKEKLVYDGKTWFASRKMEGLRCVAEITKDNVTLRTREGNEYFTLDKIKAPLIEAIKDLPDNTYIADGEVCIIREDGSEDFRAILSQWNRDDWTVEDPRYCIFDFMTLEEFKGRIQSPIFSVRYDNLQKLNLDNRTLTALEQIPLDSMETLDALIERGAVEGWEGCVLRKNIPFKPGKSVDLLKHKPYEDAEYEVVGLETGEGSFSVKGKGYITINCVKVLKIRHKGVEVEVGSGLSLDQRVEWAKDPSLIIGKIINVQYFREEYNKFGIPSLIHPSLKAVYGIARET